MKSLINFFPLLFVPVLALGISLPALSAGIIITHYNQISRAMEIKQLFQRRGVPIELIEVINKSQPCRKVGHAHFIALCLQDNAQTKVISTSPWMHRSLAFFYRKSQEEKKEIVKRNKKRS